MVLSLRLVYLSTVVCISEEINLGPCGHKDILRVKGQRKSQNVTFLSQCNQIALIEWPLFDASTSAHGVFLLRLVYQSHGTAACISEEINLAQGHLRVKGQALITNRNFYEFVQQYSIF